MTAVGPGRTPAPFDGRRALGAGGLLRDFGEAGILAAADVHVAVRLAALTPEGAAEAVQLGVALAVRAPRLGSVCIDLATVRESSTSDVEVSLGTLPWPDPALWLDALRDSALVAVGEDGPGDRPLRLLGSRLYLDRYWREERAIARDLRARAEAPSEDVDAQLLGAGLDRLFGPGAPGPPGGPDGPGAPDAPDDPPDRQRHAAKTAVLRRLTVVAGGPGTGKTTTVARILALLVEQALSAGRPPPRMALAAPTGKAAARLQEAVHSEAAALCDDGALDPVVRARLLATEASTLHHLLGWRPGSRRRLRHDRTNRLPHDVVVVDETSMVSLSLMARLLAAVRDDARLVLLGDPEQLASVEAGAVLGDVVGPAAALGGDAAERAQLPDPPERPPLAASIVVLHRVHRYGQGLADLAQAIQRGDAEATLAVLTAGHLAVRFLPLDLAATTAGVSVPALLREPVAAATRRVVAAAEAGDGAAALEALAAVRILCAHRRGPYGAETWRARVESWLQRTIDGYGTGGRWYVGRPLLITRNDDSLRLHNGDIGVIVAAGEGQRVAVFERHGELIEVAPSRLEDVETVHAMTVHKSQGSQLPQVAVLLPDAGSPVLTRELLYTAVTRAQERVTVVGTEAAVRAAVDRPVARASGLREALWGAGEAGVERVRP